MRNGIFFLFGSLLFCFLGVLSPAKAETLNSDSYTVRLGNFNMTSGLKSSASYNLTDTVGQIAAEFFAGNGYHVKAGFQYIYTLYDFSFTISSLLIDLGELTPGTFKTASHTLMVSAPGQGYSVSAHELTPLKNESENTIPDTTCNISCTETVAGLWDQTIAHGFGYNVAGDDVSPDFISSLFFRPFPDLSKGDVPATVMITSQAGKNRTATVTYQANIEAGQPGGAYATQIIYIATPVY